MVDNVNGVPMSTWAKIFSNLTASAVPPSTNQSSWTTSLKNSEAGQLASALFDVAQSDRGLAFWYLDPLTAQPMQASLYTPQPYASGSSISHLDSTVYEGTSDWLMRAFAVQGVKIGEVKPVALDGSGIGEATKGMLAVLGYSLKGCAIGEQTKVQRRAVKEPTGRLHFPPDVSH